MELDLPAGRYVVAVSGGVDSMALLHKLAHTPGMKLTVAHLDHGIRPDSAEDRRLVQRVSEKYKLPFVFHEAKLGTGASEATARKARYDFLRQVAKASGASAIITAHHQDDVLETIILNLLRGTGRKGLSSLQSTAELKRPLLNTTKQGLLRYAKAHHLEWREDSTNLSDGYLRNYIRHHLLPRFDAGARAEMLGIARAAATRNQKIDVLVSQILDQAPETQVLHRTTFLMLPHAVATEVMAAWLRRQGDIEITRALVNGLVVAAKTGRIGSRVDVNRRLVLEIQKETLALRPRER